MDHLSLVEAEALLSEAPEERISIVDAADSRLLPQARNTVVFAGTHCRDIFEKSGIPCWCGVEAEPATETVEKMIAFLRERRPDSVVAAGGGSVLDAAKAAWLAFQTGTPLAELFGVNRWSSAHAGVKLKRLTAIPTTSGTGSEATPYANIVDHKLAVKKLIVEAEAVPDRAFLVPELTFSMPQALTRAVGVDALAHLMEGFLNVGADGKHPRANLWALTGISLIRRYLPRALKDGRDVEARRAMCVAAALGGMTIRFKSTGLPHLCSFSWFGRIAHGDAVAMLLPGAWRYYLGNPAVEARTMELRSIFPGRNAMEVIANFRAFLSEVGLPEKLSAWSGITPELLAQTARCGRENRMKLELAPLPVPLEKSEEILLKILTESY